MGMPCDALVFLDAHCLHSGLIFGYRTGPQKPKKMDVGGSIVGPFWPWIPSQIGTINFKNFFLSRGGNMMLSFYAYCFHSGPNFDTREQVPRTPQMMCVDQLWAHSDFRFCHKSELISKISVKFELLIGHTILSYFFWCSLLAHLHSRLRFDQNQSLETRKWM